MKPTPSKDGIVRFTVSVKFRAGREDLATAILGKSMVYGDPFPKTRKGIIDSFKSMAWKAGETMWTSTDTATKQDWNSAYAHIDSKFPELKPEGRKEE